MCPQQAFAAAGLPRLYKVRPDPKWNPDTPPPVIISAQCEHPDESLIEVWFHNRKQFPGDAESRFRVLFERGRVVAIDRKGITFP